MKKSSNHQPSVYGGQPSEPIVTLFLKRGKSESLKRFHPWVFSGAIAGSNGKVNEGDIVRVVSDDDLLMGYGHYQIGSIAVRMLTFDDEPIDHEFWKSRLAEAFRLRSALQLTGARIMTSTAWCMVRATGCRGSLLTSTDVRLSCRRIPWVCM